MQQSKELVKLLEKKYGHRRVDLRRKINQQILSGGMTLEEFVRMPTYYRDPCQVSEIKKPRKKRLAPPYNPEKCQNTIKKGLGAHNNVDYKSVQDRKGKWVWRTVEQLEKRKDKERKSSTRPQVTAAVADTRTPRERRKDRMRRMKEKKLGLRGFERKQRNSRPNSAKRPARPTEILTDDQTLQETSTEEHCNNSPVDRIRPKRKAPVFKPEECKGLTRTGNPSGPHANTDYRAVQDIKGKWVWRKVSDLEKRNAQENTRRTKQPSTIPKIDGMGVKELEKQLKHCMAKSKGMEKRIKDYQQKLKKCGKKKKTKKRNEDDFYEMPEERGEEVYPIEIKDEITPKQLVEVERVVNRKKRPVRIINLTGEGATAARQKVEERIDNDEVTILINGTNPDNIMEGKRKRMKREYRFANEQARDVEGDKSSAVYKDRLALPWTVLENIGEDLWWYWNAYIWLTCDYYSKYDDNDGNHIANSELKGKNVTKLLQDGKLQERTSRLVELYLPEIFFFSKKGHPHEVWTNIDQDQASENLDLCLKSNDLVHKTRIFGENPDPRAKDFVGKDESEEDAIISLYDRIKLVFKAYQYQAHTITDKNMYRRPQVEEPNEDDYKILGLNKPEKKNLSDFLKNLKKVYKQKALQHHPDKGGDPKTFKKIKIATKRIETFLKHKGENVANEGDNYDHNLAIFGKYENTTEQNVKDWKYKSQVGDYNKLKKMHEDKAKRPWNDFLSTHAKKLPGGDNDAYADERPNQEDYPTTSSYFQAMKEYIGSLDKTFNEIDNLKEPEKLKKQLKEQFGRFREFERTNFTVYDSVQQIMKEGYPEDKAVHIYSHQQSCNSKEEQDCNYDDDGGKFSYTCMTRTDDDEKYIGCFPVSLEGILYDEIIWDENDVRKDLGTDEWLVYKRNGEWVSVDSIYRHLSVTLDNIKKRLRSGKVSVTDKELRGLKEKEGGTVNNKKVQNDDFDPSEYDEEEDDEEDDDEEDDEEYLWELL